MLLQQLEVSLLLAATATGRRKVSTVLSVAVHVDWMVGWQPINTANSPTHAVCWACSTNIWFLSFPLPPLTFPFSSLSKFSPSHSFPSLSSLTSCSFYLLPLPAFLLAAYAQCCSHILSVMFQSLISDFFLGGDRGMPFFLEQHYFLLMLRSLNERNLCDTLTVMEYSGHFGHLKTMIMRLWEAEQ